VIWQLREHQRGMVLAKGSGLTEVEEAVRLPEVLAEGGIADATCSR